MEELQLGHAGLELEEAERGAEVREALVAHGTTRQNAATDPGSMSGKESVLAYWRVWRYVKGSRAITSLPIVADGRTE